MKHDIKKNIVQNLYDIKRTTGTKQTAMLLRLIEDLSLDTVEVTIERRYVEPSSPVPHYDATVDGDYEQFLVSNNID